MLKRNSKIRFAGMITVLVAAGAVLCSAAAQKMPVPRPQDNLAMGEDQVRQLLPLMHADKNGMVSRQEYMKFMEAEFDRLDQEKKGELDAGNWRNRICRPAVSRENNRATRSGHFLP